jgi:toxin-antitoxin system PIN domain toxin
MILVDVNLLLYAYNASTPQHAEARIWLEETIVKPEPFGLSWITILAFLRISTNPRAFPHPFSIEEAIEIINDLLDQASTILVEPGAGYWTILSSLLTTTQSHGPLVMDAHQQPLSRAAISEPHRWRQLELRYPSFHLPSFLPQSSYRIYSRGAPSRPQACLKTDDEQDQ